jgi:hypothetical protein
VEKIIETDIFIAGAGAGGIAAAYAAAECGMNVIVAERNSFPGGRATASAVGTICGLYLRSDSKPVFAMQGFPKIFAEQLMLINQRQPVKFAEGLWFIPCHPHDFEKTAVEFLSHAGIKVLYNTSVEQVNSSGGKIESVLCSSGKEKQKIIPKSVIDCSGEGIICSLLKHRMLEDREYQAAAIVFSLRNISVSDEFQLSFSMLKKITSAIEEKKVPEYFNLLSIIPYSLSSNTVMMKLGLPWKINESDRESIHLNAQNLVMEIYKFIKESVNGFENAEIDWIAKEVGVRTGSRAKGKNVLTDDDVLSCRKDADGICNGAWATEYWKTGNKRVEMTYFKEDDFYTIPSGCLQSDELENFFFAGKIISAEEKAIASARVIGTCLGTGYAAGVLASYYAQDKSVNEGVTYIQNKLHLAGKNEVTDF